MQENRQKSADFLEQLQKEYYGNHTDYAIDRFKENKDIPPEIADKVVEELAKVAVPSIYQDKANYKIIADIIEEINSVKEYVFEEKTTNRQMPVFGTFDMNLFFSALCQSKSDESCRIVLFSKGFILFALLISKIVAQAFPVKVGETNLVFSTDVNDIKNKIETNNAVKTRFIDLMLACLITREPQKATPYFTGMEYMHFSSMIIHSFESFIVGHEYTHYILNHLDSDSNPGNFGNFETNILLRNWKDEVEADFYGAMLAYIIMMKRGCDEVLSTIGIIVSLYSIELFEKLDKIRQGINKDETIFSATHPPAELRKANLLKAIINDDMKKKFLDSVDCIFQLLWDEFMKFYQALTAVMPVEDIMKSDSELCFRLAQSVLYKVMNVED